uniref:Putative 1-deoxy-D-xylulose-5-phosphate synthase n=1 Tax=Streptomyces argenteolus TaxID=67274 RepID=A9ZNU4_9ACTN|nr:putative 1-deoxy-D-xylulose-5-phosphate synthase [Streptomyces argenteolus]
MAAVGGRLGSSLEVVELTIALHRVFDSPVDPIVFDTGHQAYVHRILTGHANGFGALSGENGFSGYPSRGEGEPDLAGDSHTSAALSYADGLAKAFALREVRRAVVTVVSDAALTGGMCWEALNNIAVAKDRQVVIVVNDNGRSYASAFGGLARHLSVLRLSPAYESLLLGVREGLSGTTPLGDRLFTMLKLVKNGLKDMLSPQALFEDLGIKYIGPVPGHDLRGLEQAMRRAKRFGGPVVVHTVTRKGQGYRPAGDDAIDRPHTPGGFTRSAARQAALPVTRWTDVFAEELVSLARERDDIVGVTTGMSGPTGIAGLARAFPDRVFDVGVAERHAATSAAGLAMGGVRPVVAIRSTFLNRAFDQIIMDVALNGLPVTFVADHAGITGSDGPGHNGIWDLAVFGVVPGMRIAAPRDAVTLRAVLREALAFADGPTLIRFPAGAVLEALPEVGTVGGVDVLHHDDRREFLLVAVGRSAVWESTRRAVWPTKATVPPSSLPAGCFPYRTPWWISPVPTGSFSPSKTACVWGASETPSPGCRDNGVGTPVRTFGILDGRHAHGTREEVLADLGLTADALAETAMKLAVSGQDRPSPAVHPVTT